MATVQQFDLLQKSAVTQIQADLEAAVEADRIAAQQARAGAELAKTAAETAKTGAEAARDAAITAKDTATTQAGIATTKAGEALTSASNANTAKLAAETAQAGAVAAKDTALANNELLGGIAYNAAAPTPGKSGKYSFTTGGNCTWLTGGAATVAVGDEVVVVYTAPSTYTYTKIARQDIEQIFSDYTTPQNGIIRQGIYYNRDGEDASYPTVSSSPLIPCTTSDIIEFKTSAEGTLYPHYVFFNSEREYVYIVTDSSKKLSGDAIPATAAYIGINQETGVEQIVCINGKVVFNYNGQINDNKDSIAAIDTIINNVSFPDVTQEDVFVNLLPNVGLKQIFNQNAILTKDGYQLKSSIQNTFTRTISTHTYHPGHKVALVAKIRFDNVSDDFRLQFGFNNGSGWDNASREYNSDYFGVQNLSGQTKTFSLIHIPTAASYPLFYIYKAEVASGQFQQYTILEIAVIDMGADSSHPLYNKSGDEMALLFNYCKVLDGDVFYKKISTKNGINPKLIGEKTNTLGDSLSLNTFQPHLVKLTGINWSKKETVDGDGYVHLTTGTWTGEDKSGDPNYRHAYPTSIGGTLIRPNSVNSIYMRSFDVKHYMPKRIIIYGGQNDLLFTWKTAGNTGTTPDEIVANEVPYTANAVNDSISVLRAYKGMIENTLAACPNAIIYLVTQMRVLGRVGMLDESGNVRFPTIQSVIDWENTERYPKVEYIRALGKFYNLPVIDLWVNSGINNYNAEYWYGEPAPDCTQVHPEQWGYDRKAEVMATFM